MKLDKTVTISILILLLVSFLTFVGYMLKYEHDHPYVDYVCDYTPTNSSDCKVYIFKWSEECYKNLTCSKHTVRYIEACPIIGRIHCKLRKDVSSYETYFMLHKICFGTDCYNYNF